MRGGWELLGFCPCHQATTPFATARLLILRTIAGTSTLVPAAMSYMRIPEWLGALSVQAIQPLAATTRPCAFWSPLDPTWRLSPVLKFRSTTDTELDGEASSRV